MYNFIDHEIKMEIFLFLWNIAVFVINMHMHVYFFLCALIIFNQKMTFLPYCNNVSSFL